MPVLVPGKASEKKNPKPEDNQHYHKDLNTPPLSGVTAAYGIALILIKLTIQE